MAHIIITNLKTGLRSVLDDEGRRISIGRDSLTARHARLLLGAAALRRSAYCGDFANARGFIMRARALRLSGGEAA